MAQITLNSSGVASSGSLLLQTNGTTTQATVDTSGNLGLGVTPSAWSGVKAIEITSAGCGIYSFGTTDVRVTGNSYWNGSAYKYGSTNLASMYVQNSGVHYWYNAASGTAGNSITWTQAMTLDASGNLLLGATSISNNGLVIEKSNAEIRLQNSSATNAAQLYTNSSGFVLGSVGSTPLIFRTNATERAQIDSSGNLLVGTTSTSDSVGFKLIAESDNRRTAIFCTTATASTPVAFFRNGNGNVGSISTSGTSTSYATSSDYRLKESIQPMTGALEKIAALKPCTYKWKADGSDGEGFIAHELAEVVPQCVVGEKDAVDQDGNPVYQGIDTSFLVAALTAAIQELKAEFDAYKAAHP